MMAAIGWVAVLSMAVYMSAAGFLAVMFGGLSPVKTPWFIAFLVAMIAAWYLVWLSCPFSIHLNT